MAKKNKIYRVTIDKWDNHGTYIIISRVYIDDNNLFVPLDSRTYEVDKSRGYSTRIYRITRIMEHLGIVPLVVGTDHNLGVSYDLTNKEAYQ